MAKEATPEKPAAETPAPAGQGGWMPVIAVLVLVPVLSFAMAQFVLFPRLEKMLAAAGANAGASEGAHGAESASHGSTHAGAKGANLDPVHAHEFKDIVSNLAGSMKSRYIKVSFTAYSANPQFSQIVETNRAKMLDATLSVLSSLSLADMEDTGVKNKVRNELVFAYESVLRGRVVEEIYFSEFVIQ